MTSPKRRARDGGMQALGGGGWRKGRPRPRGLRRARPGPLMAVSARGTGGGPERSPAPGSPRTGRSSRSPARGGPSRPRRPAPRRPRPRPRRCRTPPRGRRRRAGRVRSPSPPLAHQVRARTTAPRAASARAAKGVPLARPPAIRCVPPGVRASRAAMAASGLVALESLTKATPPAVPTGSRRGGTGRKVARPSARAAASRPAGCQAAAAIAFSRLWRPRRATSSQATTRPSPATCSPPSAQATASGPGGPS